MTSIHAVTPFAGHGLLFVSSGYFPDNPEADVCHSSRAPAGDISLKASETSNDFIAWSNPTLASAYPSPLVLGDQYYTLMDRGFLTSNDARTGKEVTAGSASPSMQGRSRRRRGRTTERSSRSAKTATPS